MSTLPPDWYGDEGDAASTGGMDTLLAAMDVTVVEVPGLRAHACWVRAMRVALVRAELSADERERALEALLLAQARRRR